MKNTKYRGKMFDVNINAIKRTKNGRLDNIKEARMKEREREKRLKTLRCWFAVFKSKQHIL